MALGVYAKNPGYIRHHVDRALCHRAYMYRAPAWSSVDALWYIIILIPSSLIIFFALPVEAVPEEVLLLEKLCDNREEKLACRLAFSCTKLAECLDPQIPLRRRF